MYPFFYLKKEMICNLKYLERKRMVKRKVNIKREEIYIATEKKIKFKI